jgi:hypothetical protein
MFTKTVIATALIAVAGLSQAAVIAPGGNLGDLSPSPALYGGFYVNEEPDLFSASYTFSLTQQSEVLGSVSFLAEFLNLDLEPLIFTDVLLDGVSVGVLGEEPSGNFGFSLGTLGAGTYTLTFTGLADRGTSAFTGSLYSQVAAIPEPDSIALVLAGAGIVGAAALRRRRAANS